MKSQFGKDSIIFLRNGLGFLENQQTRGLPTDFEVWLFLKENLDYFEKSYLFIYFE